MNFIGANRDLPTHPRPSIDTDLLQGKGHQSGGDLFATGHNRVIFARIVDRCHASHKADEPVGLASHGRHDDRNLVTLIDGLFDTCRGMADSVDATNRRPAEFLNDDGHATSELWNGCLRPNFNLSGQKTALHTLAMIAKQAVEPVITDAPSIDPAEVEQFDALANSWWDPDGPFRPLHRLTPARLGYLRDRLADHYGRDILADRPFEGLRGIDVGCGGGLISEPLARLGLAMTGLDAGARNIAAARSHAADQGLNIDYRCSTAEALAAAGERFDVVLALEIVEHVADRRAFVSACCELATPGGLIVFSTINRTAKAFGLAIVGAEYVLRWLPRGSHNWRKFVKPSELARDLRAAGARPTDTKGLVFSPLNNLWHLDADLDVNYFMTAIVDANTRGLPE